MLKNEHTEKTVTHIIQRRVIPPKPLNAFSLATVNFCKNPFCKNGTQRKSFAKKNGQCIPWQRT